MTKNLTLLILSLLFIQLANAQNVTDTLLTYHKKDGSRVDRKDNADYFIVIMPENSTSHLSAIHEYYANGKDKLISQSSTRKYNSLKFQGKYISFYPNGNRKCITNYDNGLQIGDVKKYYPNGKLYCIEKHLSSALQLVECKDSTGEVLAQNGKGKWLRFDEDMSYLIESGPVSNGLEEDGWDFWVKGDNSKYCRIYKEGRIVSPTDTTKGLVFEEVQTGPNFANDGQIGFSKYLSENIVYPIYDKENDIQGKVIVTFIVEKDGTLSNAIALRGPDKFTEDEAVRVVLLSPPWIPGKQNGQVVRSQCAIQIEFNLANKK